MVPSCSPGLELSFDIYNAFWMKYAETLFMRNTPVQSSSMNIIVTEPHWRWSLWGSVPRPPIVVGVDDVGWPVPVKKRVGSDVYD